MSNVKNITRVYLLNVPLENDYKNTLFFDNKTAQETYFKSRIVARFSDFSYQRKDGIIKVPSKDDNYLATEFDNLLNLGVNYVMYQNTAYSNKWFYAFIKDIRYGSDSYTELEIETDVLQSWYFNYRIKESFVEREHVTDDTIGLHTVPENLETGEYVANFGIEKAELGENYIIVGTTYDNNQNVIGSIYSGIYSGVRYKAYKWTNYGEVSELLLKLAKDAKSDAITSVFICPGFIVEDMIGDDNNLQFGTLKGKKSIEIPKSYPTLNLYNPRNNKLLSYPYNYLLATNNNGGSAIYRYEDFKDVEGKEGYCLFDIYGVVTPGCSIKMIPLNYKNANENIEESLNAGKFPICNWNTDVYTNWLTQNSVNMATSLVGSSLQVIGGLGLMATGAGAMAGGPSVASGILGIASAVGQKYQQSLVPPQAEGNLNSGDVLTSMNENTFTFYPMSIKAEYAKIIDKYFDLYGYQVNHVKVPNYNHRAEYWYTKTIDINIDGAIPMMDMQKIKDCYNNGITFWRNPEHIQDYSISNEIIV